MKRTRQYWEKQLGEEWTSTLKDTLRDPYMDKLMNFISTEYAISNVFPINYEDLFLAFRLCSWDKIKVVIIGEEPSRLTGTSSLAFGDSLIHSFTNPSLQKIQECIFDEYYEENHYVHFMTTVDQSLKSWAKLYY
jgi:uracil DNA glycosylase